MRRRSLIVMAAALFVTIAFCSLSFAQGMGGAMAGQSTMERDMAKSDMRAKGKMMEKCPMHGMMRKGMMEKSVIAAADGGVIVLVGNKLMKYDKNLNLIKEAEIKIDLAAMQRNMTEMMKDCPMMKDCSMMKGDMMGADVEEKLE